MGLSGDSLQVTRAEGDASRLRSETVALHELVGAIVDDGRLETSAQVRAGFILFPPAGDPELLRRAIENVVRNAIRYSPAGKDVEVKIYPGMAKAPRFKCATTDPVYLRNL